MDLSVSTTSYFKLEIMATGGEFTYGFVTNKDQKDLIRKKIDSSTICIENYEGDVEALFFMFDDVVHVYGPSGANAKVSLSIYSDEDCENEVKEIFYNEHIDDIGVHSFMSLNPNPNEFKKNYDSDALMFGGYYIEKRVRYPVVIKIEQDEKFDVNNLYIGTVSLDETLSEDEIVDRVLYIRPDIATKIMNIYSNGEYCDESLSDYIHEIYYDFNDLDKRVQELLTKAVCDPLDIEGKGAQEEQFVIVKTMDDDILFEGYCYG